MEVSKIKYYDVNTYSGGKFIAKCSVYLDDCLVLHEIKLLSGKKGRYIVMPSTESLPNKTVGDVNEHKDDLFHPVDAGFFSYLLDVILEGFKNYEENGSKIFIP